MIRNRFFCDVVVFAGWLWVALPAGHAFAQAPALTFAELQDRLRRDGVDRVADEMRANAGDGLLAIIARSLNQSRRELRDSPDQLWFQLAARNMGAGNDELAKFLGPPPAAPMLVSRTASLRQTSPAVVRMAFDREPGVNYLRLVDDDKKLVCSMVDMSVRVLDAASLKEISKFSIAPDSPYRRSTSPDNPWVGIDSKGGVVFANNSIELGQPDVSQWQHALHGIWNEYTAFYCPASIVTKDGTHIISCQEGQFGVARIKGQLSVVNFSLDKDALASRHPFMRVLPDGERLIYGDEFGNLSLYEWRTGKPLKPFTPLKIAVSHYALSGDGKRLALANEAAATLWDIESWQEVAKFREGGYSRSMSVDFLGDSSTVVTLDMQQSAIRIWRVGSEKPVKVLQTPTSLLRCVANRAGNRIYGVAHNHSLVVLSIEKLPEAAATDYHRAEVKSVAISPDGKLVASLGYPAIGGDLAIWETATGKLVDRIEYQQAIGATTIVTEGVTFGPDSEDVMLTGLIENQPAIIHYSGKPRRRHEVLVEDRRFAPPSSALRESVPNFQPYPNMLPNGQTVFCIHREPNGEGTLVLMNATTGATVRDLNMKVDRGMVPAASQDSVICLLGRDAGSMYVSAVDIETEKTQRVPLFRREMFNSAISAKGNVFAANGSDERHKTPNTGLLIFANIETGEVKRVSSGLYRTLTLTPDGQFAFTVDRTKLQAWDTKRGENVATFTLDRPIVAICSDGRTVAVGDEGGRLHLFDWRANR